MEAEHDMEVVELRNQLKRSRPHKDIKQEEYVISAGFLSDCLTPPCCRFFWHVPDSVFCMVIEKKQLNLLYYYH